ncbi:MAG: type II secretion system protein GspD, partial [Aquabacterium sp.]|nr:type II secretion system protein GspD [Aquabacterium sp.]
GPTTNKNSLETTVVADDGQIMVLGGQMKDEYTDGENKVPLLGDVPMMGNLFKSTSRERRKSVMLVFLRPVVIRDAQAATSLTMDRYEAIRAQQQASQPAQSSVMSINQSPVLPALPGSVPAVMPTTPPTTPQNAQPTPQPAPAPKAP